MADDRRPEELAAGLYAGLGLVLRRLRKLQAPGEPSLPERAALSRLDRGGPTTAAELARGEQITAQAMGTTLAALEERGFVERRRDPGDGRRAIMSVTAAGVAVLRRKRDARAQQLAKVIEAEFTAAQRETLQAAVPLLERVGEHL